MLSCSQSRVSLRLGPGAPSQPGEEAKMETSHDTVPLGPEGEAALTTRRWPTSVQ